MGLSADLARGTLRFGLGRFNTEADVDLAIELVAGAAAKLREFG
jgi:cysteine sulfinate desulfinase/cysteine desulfurase-like protein